MNLRKLTAAVAVALSALCVISGCTAGDGEPGASPGVENHDPLIIDWADHDRRAEQFVTALVNGEYTAAAAGFDAVMTQMLGEQGLRAAWEDVSAEAGDFISVESVETVPHDEYDIYNVISRHENTGINTNIVFSGDGLVAGLFFSFVDIGEQDASPVQRDGYTDIPVVIGEGSDYPLRGIVSMPDNVVDRVPAVVLVHGSGPIDMNSTVYGVTVFADIADHLAKNGIAVIRYDKRTYAHGERLIAQYGDELTVREETIDDAVLAKAVLAQDERVNADRIFVLGHSLGGMLAPRIVSEGNFAGGIIMAGSPRSLIDIIYDQSMYSIGLANLTGDERNALYEQVEAAREVFFTLPEAYITEMDAHPAAEYLTGTDKPFLIMQGETDFQVYAGVDFALYAEIAAGRENMELRLYEGLNHLFTRSVMESPTTEDYVAGTPVDSEPLADIAAWIWANT